MLQVPKQFWNILRKACMGTSSPHLKSGGIERMRAEDPVRLRLTRQSLKLQFNKHHIPAPIFGMTYALQAHVGSTN